MPAAAKKNREKKKERAESVLEPAAPITDSFDELPLSPANRKAVADAGFESPTPIQSRAIPAMVEGRDLIGQAQTGTGKTVAFALPLIQMVDESSNVTQALVLAPTR